MGTFGRRPALKNNDYTEPLLIKDVNDIISAAKSNNWIDDKGNIDVKKVAESKNIRLEYIPMESSISGYLRQENGEWIIGVNSIHNPKRQRFTIAHELGHFYMHKDKNVDFEDTTFFRNTDNSSIEYSANEFAANLLMPEDSIRKAIQTGTKNIEDLSSQFNVSIAAIKYRVLSLGYKLKS